MQTSPKEENSQFVVQTSGPKDFDGAKGIYNSNNIPWL